MSQVIVHDFDDDGRLDLVTTGYWDSKVYVLLNTTPTTTVGVRSGRAPVPFEMGPVRLRGGRAEVEFSNALAGRIRLVLYDVTGRRISTVLDRTMEPGSHVASWEWAGAPQGVYFLRLQAEEGARSRTVVHVR